MAKRSSEKPREAPNPRPVRPRGLWLWVECLWFFVLLLPYILLDFRRRLFPPKLKSLDGKVVLITGAGRGLGRDLALVFARVGCRVACVDIDKESVLETASDIVRDGERARAYVTNVARVEEVKALGQAVSRDLGPVDILVNNAALVYNQRLEDTPDDAVNAIVSVNLLGYVWMVREFLPAMKDRGSGHVVAVSSLAAHTALPNMSLYASSKWAVSGFMESVRQEVLLDGYENIFFTTVYPTFLNTAPVPPTVLTPSQRSIMMTSQEAALRTLAAVRRNTVSASFPEYLYLLCILSKLMPQRVTDWACEIISGGGRPAPQQTLLSFQHIVQDTVKH